MSDLDSTDKVRVRIKSISISGVGFRTVEVRGNVAVDGEPAPGVQYNTSTGDKYASKTPDADDRISWDAIAVN